MSGKTISVTKTLYPSLVVIKAAYAFVDSCYIHIDETDTEWVIHITPKLNGNESYYAQEMENELIAQAVRYSVSQRTHVVRELLLARAMASSMAVVDFELPSQLNPEEDISEEELDTILTSWFDRHE